MATQGQKAQPRRGKNAKPLEPKAKAARPTALVPRVPPPATPPSPLALMRRFTERMDRLFEDFRLGVPRLGLPLEGREVGWMPSVEVVERGGRLVVRADLPGLTKDDVKVEVRDDALCIQGERRQERKEKREGIYRSERTYGSFYREIPLPEGTDPAQAKASFRDGVLEVSVPAPPRPATGRRVPIEGP